MKASSNGTGPAAAGKSERESSVLPVRELRDFRFDGARVDIRGWDVCSGDRQTMGFVDTMFVDARARRIRYLGVALRDGANDTAVRRVLVPVGIAQVSPDRARTVTLPSLSAAQLRAAPRLPARPVTAADENAALAAYGMSEQSAPPSVRYDAPIFEEERLFVPSPARNGPR